MTTFGWIMSALMGAFVVVQLVCLAKAVIEDRRTR